ncbi:MAG TPA: hypothetical protein VL098_02260 [Flavipsychrobacter sp.]|nr:hypothetical protein [Flavipsychrobacter sp.]
MNPSSLYQDLVDDFKKQNELIDEQVAIFEPITKSLRKPAAQRLLSKSFLVILEIIFYCLFAGGVLFAFMLNHLVPFYILNTLKERGSATGFVVSDVNVLYWSIIGMTVLIAVLCWVVARLLRKMRLKNTVIYTVNKHIRVLLAQHLQRKATIDAIEKRHFTELPDLRSPDHANVNQVPNPGY